MYRYFPPKASVWGHSLRRMPVARARNLLATFLDTAAKNYQLAQVSLWIDRAEDQAIQRYEKLIGMPAERRRNTDLTLAQADMCLTQLIQDEKEFRATEKCISLWYKYEVTRWLANKSELVPTSIITIHYDNWPHLQTELYFESISEFEHVKEAFAASGLCKLNPKHLKATKRSASGMKRSSAEA